MEAAARLLADEGPQALTTRRLAAAVGSSTTAVYTHFGGMDDLVRAMVHEGFARLDRRMSEVTASGDPVADIAALGLAYRDNAREHRHLYGVMFGGVGFGGFSLTEEDQQHGRYTLEPVARAVSAAMAAGRFQEGDARLVAHQMWIALHGLATLELGGFLVRPYDADRCFAAQVYGLLVGAGDDPARARRSLERLGVPVGAR
ncbi:MULTISPECIES: TetR/AcrR family transcriptional regulator [unclassified Streptomyces]|uniref:TetR/AcrR family transcriptional regulator n=1 Tax=unclassified Streptomyces TaxID=2593676 RepID=UPI000A5102D6|nr:TetR/AcrR family transcriptional regulator [Streptomyces sp. TSRI0107]